MGWLAVALTPSALVGVWALWKNLKVKRQDARVADAVALSFLNAD